ncbi:MAG: hypothetical protein KDA52_19830 [Planctomycetaceae bacterium]|nr:hypothetical protein [Planctomycetaceae bacterium]
MTIPAFDSILNVLPTHLGDPRKPNDLSPYPCTVDEVCGRFATSGPRKAILDGFLNLRRELFKLGVEGFQWLDGSFLEDIEAQENRDPKDVDVITFISKPVSQADFLTLQSTSHWLLDRNATKQQFSVDHFVVHLGSSPRLLVDLSRYWYGLFSHRRDGLWKGMLSVELVDQADDVAARVTLGGAP